MAKGREEAVGPSARTRGTQSGGGSVDMSDLEYVKGLIDAVDASGIDSLEITRAGTRVKISKTPPGTGGVYQGGGASLQAPAPPGPNAGPQTPAVEGGAPAATPPAGAPGPGEAAAAAAGREGSGLVDVPSPMVGTFYRAPAPEAPPYVEVGTRVAKGQTLCILEAMKLMNELESEVEGVIRQVLVENAEPVEYGQVLFRIDPSG